LCVVARLLRSRDMMTWRIVKPVKQCLSIDDSPYSDFLAFAADVEIDLRDFQHLQRPQPIADVLEHERQVGLMLERLKLHLVNRFLAVFSSTLVRLATSSSVKPANATSWPAA